MCAAELVSPEVARRSGGSGDIRWAWALALGFLVLAIATRFYSLDWTFSGDELIAFDEAQSLRDKPFVGAWHSLADILPRGHPVAYGLQLLTYEAFGQGEFGARVGVATAGALSVFLIVLLTHFLFGRLSALYIGVMLILWPWHLQFSQTNRMYSYAFLFGSLAILSGALAWSRNSFCWASLSGVASACAIGSHNSTAVIPAFFVLHALVEYFRARDPLPRHAVVGYALVGIPLVLLAFGVGWLSMRHWAQGVSGYYGWSVPPVWLAGHGMSEFGMRPVITLLGLANHVGWAVTIFCIAGLVWAWRRGSSLQRMLAIFVVMIAVMCAVAPVITVFRIDYAYGVSLVFLLFASQVLVAIHQSLKAHSRVLAWAVAGVFFLPIMPGFASYYQDGNRHDYRTAAAYVIANWQEGDIVAADSNMILAHYLPCEVLPAERPAGRSDKFMEALGKIAATGRRTWYVCRYDVGESPQWADQWLWQHAVRVLRIKKPRFDHNSNIVDVYLLNGAAPAPMSGAEALPKQAVPEGKGGE